MALGQAQAQPKLLPSISFLKKMKCRTSSAGALREEKPWRAGTGSSVRGHPALSLLCSGLSSPLHAAFGTAGTRQMRGLVPQPHGTHGLRATSRAAGGWRKQEARAPLFQNKIKFAAIPSPAGGSNARQRTESSETIPNSTACWAWGVPGQGDAVEIVTGPQDTGPGPARVSLSGQTPRPRLL